MGKPSRRKVSPPPQEDRVSDTFHVYKHQPIRQVHLTRPSSRPVIMTLYGDWSLKLGVKKRKKTRKRPPLPLPKATRAHLDGFVGEHLAQCSLHLRHHRHGGACRSLKLTTTAKDRRGSARSKLHKPSRGMFVGGVRRAPLVSAEKCQRGNSPRSRPPTTRAQ